MQIQLTSFASRCANANDVPRPNAAALFPPRISCHPSTQVDSPEQSSLRLSLVSMTSMPFTTHHNVTCLNWYCQCAVATADEDCWCEELTGHLCESCSGDIDY